MESNLNPQPLQIIITVFQDGKMDVQGPADLIVFYGMVERAKDVMRDHAAEREKPKVLPSNIIGPGMGTAWAMK